MTATTGGPRQWLTTQDVCALLQCSRRTLDGMRQRGELFARPGGNGEQHKTWRYRKVDVLRLAGLAPAATADAQGATQESERARVAAYHRLVARLHRQLALANDELARALDGDDATGPERTPQ